MCRQHQPPLIKRKKTNSPLSSRSSRRSTTSTPSLRTRPSERRTLGIDPGYGRIGYGAISETGQRLALLTYGCIETPPGLSRPRRLVAIGQAVRSIIKQVRPDLVAVETLFFSKNVRTALGVSEARGVILATIGALGCPIIELNPSQVKSSLTGYGRAEKQQVARLVERLLHLPEKVRSDDAADALALAICATHTQVHLRS